MVLQFLQDFFLWEILTYLFEVSATLIENNKSIISIIFFHLK